MQETRVLGAAKMGALITGLPAESGDYPMQPDTSGETGQQRAK